jgi:hypothetical protein
MSEHAYDTLAEVYDRVVPDALPTPDGSVDAFASAAIDGLEPWLSRSGSCGQIPA